MQVLTQTAGKKHSIPSHIDKKLFKAIMEDLVDDYTELLDASIDLDTTENTSLTTVQDVTNSGMGAGFGNFVNYSDTLKFFKKWKDEILELAKDQADGMGEELLEMLSRFGCMNKLSQSEIGEGLWAEDGEEKTTVHNCMTWYVVEEACNAFLDENDLG